MPRLACARSDDEPYSQGTAVSTRASALLQIDGKVPSASGSAAWHEHSTPACGGYTVRGTAAPLADACKATVSSPIVTPPSRRDSTTS
eukprot:1299390-Amphidinium_carterae.1